MKRSAPAVALVAFAFCASTRAQKPLSLEQILSAPFPSDLTAAKGSSRVAWVFDQQGRRNVWVTEAPGFPARQLTKYNQDDGQELSDLSFSSGGNVLLYVRGGEKNSAGQVPNPTSNPAGAEQAVWTVAWEGGEPKRIDAGHSPDASSRGTIAYEKDGQIWLAPLEGSEKPQQLVVRGHNSDPHWSPDGGKLAFVTARDDHSFIALYDVATKSISFLAPTVDFDSNFVWSLDGKRIAFVRRPAQEREASQGVFIAPDKPNPWAIWVADADTCLAKQIWHSSRTPQGSFPHMAEETGGGVLNWAANDQLLMASEEDGWQHLYALSADGGAPRLLTPGNCEVEQWSFTPDQKVVLFNSNCGDVDRRHIWSVAMAGGSPQQLTSGNGIEWSPVALNDGRTLTYLGSQATSPARPFATTLTTSHSSTALAQDTWPTDFPSDRLVSPQQVIFKSTNGVELHGQLFVPAGLKSREKCPALIFLHGGPVRQMLLGWHYMFYYSNSYAMNQYLAGRGYIVLALNYRSGIGYGRAFREAPGRAARGASEYQDVVAAGKLLQNRPDVDPKRIGLWGGSYGGYLTALGLGRNSDLFAAGVDFHDVHDWPTDNWAGKNIPAELTKLGHDSSPVAAVNTWNSPVLFIHGDDDRNVYFTQTVDLTARLREKGVEIEELIFPDEIHDFLLSRSWLAAYHAASDFFDRRLRAAEK